MDEEKCQDWKVSLGGPKPLQIVWQNVLCWDGNHRLQT